MSQKGKEFDPVCLMAVEAGQVAFSYLGIKYSFCSQQCKERFSSNPHLYIGQPGKPSPKQHGMNVIKRRVLKLDERVPEDMAKNLVVSLKKMMGIKEVTVDKNIIRITYDLLEVTTSQIEDTIIATGEHLTTALANKIKRAFIHYLEESELDNLEQESISHGHHH